MFAKHTIRLTGRFHDVTHSIVQERTGPTLAAGAWQNSVFLLAPKGSTRYMYVYPTGYYWIIYLRTVLNYFSK